jgi:predicted Zn-dependent protease
MPENRTSLAASSVQPATASSKEYVVGVMTMDVEAKHSERFRRHVEQAMKSFKETLTDALGVRVELLAFEGPHLTPAAGAYSPLDFLQIGMTEKLERDVHFLLIVTEVDLAAKNFSYTLALPSQLTNVAVISTKRLNPSFWGDEDNEALSVRHLSALLFHSFGHLLNLSHSKDNTNVMYDFTSVEELAAMEKLTDAQGKKMQQALPREARERTSKKNHWLFVIRTLFRDWRSIGRAVMRANPFRLITRLPTMITAALSVIIVVFFSAEIWDVGSTVELYQIATFSAVAVATATAVLYRAFAFSGVLSRDRELSESTALTGAATLLSLLLTMVLLFTLFMGLTYLGTVTIFPRKLMETWPTVDPAVRILEHFKLSLFVAALGVLAGSLGGRADSKDLVRAVLFVDEET